MTSPGAALTFQVATSFSEIENGQAEWDAFAARLFYHPGDYQATADFRRLLLGRARHRHGGNRSAAARELGISRQTLLYHLRSLGLGSRNA